MATRVRTRSGRGWAATEIPATSDAPPQVDEGYPATVVAPLRVTRAAWPPAPVAAPATAPVQPAERPVTHGVVRPAEVRTGDRPGSPAGKAAPPSDAASASIAEPPPEPGREAAVEPAPEPASEAANKPPSEAAGKPPTATADKPPTEAAGEPASEAANKPPTEAAGEPANAAANKPPTEAAGEPANAAVDEPASEVTVESADDPAVSAEPVATPTTTEDPAGPVGAGPAAPIASGPTAPPAVRETVTEAEATATTATAEAQAAATTATAEAETTATTAVTAGVSGPAEPEPSGTTPERAQPAGAEPRGVGAAVPWRGSRSRRALAGLGASAVVMLAALAIAWAVIRPASHGPSPRPTAPAADRPTSPPVPTQVNLYDAGTTVTVSWRGPSAGVVQFAVLAGPAGDPPTVRRMTDRATAQTTIDGFDPTRNYCFQVAAVYPTALGRSSLVCTHR